MRTIHRECRRALQPGVWFTLVFVLQILVSVRTYWSWTWAGVFNIDLLPVIANLRMVQGLLVGYVVWYVLVRQRVVAPETGHGLVLAAFGAHCRIASDTMAHCMEWMRMPFTWAPYPETPLMLEGDTGARLGSLYDAVSYGGLAAYILGFAAVVFVAISDARRPRSPR